MTGAVLAGVSSATTGWQPAARVAARVGTSAALARLQGGSLADAALYSLQSNLEAEAFRKFVGWDRSAASGKNQEGVSYGCNEIGSNCYKPDAASDGQIPLPWKDTNVIGRNFPLLGDDGDFFKQGGPLSRLLNRIPGLNAVAYDTIFNRGVLPFDPVLTNFGTMLPAAYLTYGARSSSLPADKHLCPRCQP